MSPLAGNGSKGETNSARRPTVRLGADGERDVAGTTRRVVMASLGVMKQQEANRNRSRSLALAALMVVLLILGPLAWIAVDHFISGGHLGDLTTEFNLWVCILCPALLASALVAGWLKRR